MPLTKAEEIELQGLEAEFGQAVTNTLTSEEEAEFTELNKEFGNIDDSNVPKDVAEPIVESPRALSGVLNDRAGEWFEKVFQSDKTLPERSLAHLSQVVKLGGDVFGHLAGKVIPDSVKKVTQDSFGIVSDLLTATAGTNTVEGAAIRSLKSGLEDYSVFKEKHPRVAENLENTLIVASTLPISRGAKEGFNIIGDIKHNPVKLEKQLVSTVDKRTRNIINRSDIKDSGKTLEAWREKNALATKRVIRHQDDLEYVNKNTGEITGQGLPKTGEQAVDAIDFSKRKVWNESQEVLEEAGVAVEVSKDKMIARLEGLKENVYTSDFKPQFRKTVEDQIDRLSDGSAYTLKEAQDVLAGLNADINTFHKVQNLSDFNTNLANMVARDALSETMDETLDLALSKGAGKKFFDLRKEYGALKQQENIMVAAAKKSQALPEIGSFNLGDMLTGGFGTYALMAWNPKLMAAAGVSRGLKGINKFRKGINRNIKKLYSEADGIVSRLDEPVRSFTMRQLQNRDKTRTLKEGEGTVPLDRVNPRFQQQLSGEKPPLLIEGRQFEIRPGTPDFVFGGRRQPPAQIPLARQGQKQIGFDVSDVKLQRGSISEADILLKQRGRVATERLLGTKTKTKTPPREIKRIPRNVGSRRGKLQSMRGILIDLIGGS